MDFLILFLPPVLGWSVNVCWAFHESDDKQVLKYTANDKQMLHHCVDWNIFTKPAQFINVGFHFLCCQDQEVINLRNVRWLRLKETDNKMQ